MASEVQNRVIDGEYVSTLAHGFLWLGRIGSHDVGCVWLLGREGLRDSSSEHMLLNTTLKPAFAMCGLSTAVCLTPREMQPGTDAAFRHVGSSRREIAHIGNTHAHTHSHTENEERS